MCIEPNRLFTFKELNIMKHNVGFNFVFVDILDDLEKFLNLLEDKNCTIDNALEIMQEDMNNNTFYYGPLIQANNYIIRPFKARTSEFQFAYRLPTKYMSRKFSAAELYDKYGIKYDFSYKPEIGDEVYFGECLLDLGIDFRYCEKYEGIAKVIGVFDSNKAQLTSDGRKLNEGNIVLVQKENQSAIEANYYYKKEDL